MIDEKEIIFKTEKTCCFTGHRNLDESYDRKEAEKVIENLIKRGINVFLVGMAVGFDLECFDILKEKNNIKIIACVPCKEQEKYYERKEKEEYLKNLKIADEVIYISDEYYRGCMQKRNRFMVNNSSVVVAYLRKEKGGTYYTVNYGRKKEREIIIV